MHRKTFLSSLRALIAAVLGIGIGSMLAAPGHATVITYNIPLQPEQQVPAIVSSAIGSAVVVLDDVANTVSVSGSYTGVSGNALACHIHGPAPFGQTANILHFLTVSGGSNGTIRGNVTMTPAQVQDMKNGLHYLTVHTQGFISGELRGQVLAAAIPTMGEWALIALAVGLGIVGALAAARRAPRPVSI